jgi:Leucine-rich repeat (LRR) protein
MAQVYPPYPPIDTPLERIDQLRVQAREILANEEHAEAISMIGEANGWSRDDFVSSRHEIRCIELFLLLFTPSIPQLQFFPNLVVLKLYHAGLTEIKYLDNLVHLEQLFLSENDISEIQGLDNLEKLRELYLHNNQISKMANLKKLKNLEVLWLSRNKITKIEQLEYLPKLRSFWIAGNQISTLRRAFPNNPSLEELSVAGNHISSFRDIPPLNELRSLQKLWFSDQMYGDNPICQQSNYHTFTLFHIQRLQMLDFVVISSEQRQLAESTFVKKKIYYSMRTNTLRRNLSVLCEHVRELANKKLGDASTSMGVLQNVEKQLERDLSELEHYGHVSVSTEPENLGKAMEAAREKLQLVRRAIASRRQEIRVITGKGNQTCECMQLLTEGQVTRLMLELHTGGNIRLEEGKQRDVWYQSCVELMRTRFFASDFEPYSIKEIKVAKVTRIHNRGLRAMFDTTLAEMVDVSDPSYKRALEYLFYAEPVNDDAALNRAIEFGFSTISEKSGVPMTNSVFLADQIRLLGARKRGELTGSKANPESFVTRLVVAKVFLGKCTAERAMTHSSSEESLVHAGNVDKSEYPNTSSVYRCKPNDPKQRIWYCFDAPVVLPEYIVDFTYTNLDITASQPALGEWAPPAQDDAHQQLKKLFPQSSPVDLNDFRHIGYHCLSFVNWSNTTTLSAMATRHASEALAFPHVNLQRRRIDGPLNDVAAKRFVADLTHGESKSILYANFLSMGITSIPSEPFLRMFDALKHLVLAHNQLSSIPWLYLSQCAPFIESIDLSSNLMKRLSGIENASFPKLQVLILDSNMLVKLDDFAMLTKPLPAIKHLSVCQNPFLNEKRAEAFVLRCLPTLEQLNYTIIADDADLGTIAAKPKTMHVSLVVHLVKSADNILAGGLTNDASAFVSDLSEVSRAFDLALSTTPQPIIDRVDPKVASGIVGRTSCFALNDTQITVLDSVDLFRRLVVLQMRGSLISDMDPVSQLTSLEVLDLQDNRITRLAGIKGLNNLRRLDLCKNYLESVDGIEELRNLQYVAIDYNKITTLQPFGVVSGLMELYCSNNAIANEKDSIHLRELPKLIILDLAGNPCVTAELYRLYVVFQVKKLKVLDGISIDAQEMQLARDTFAGRVSAELLNERVLPGVPWSQAKELTLTNCALKDITLLDSFSSLTHLRLEHNQISNIDGLKQCTNLMILNLGHNRLSTCPVGKVLELMPNLESLSLEANGISSIAQLQLCSPKLKFLNLKGNEILKVDGLEKVPMLREVLLEKNKLRAIERESFAFVPNLRELYLEENAIKSIDGIAVLGQLLKLSLASNRLQEVSDIGRVIDGLPLTDVCFLGNPVVRKAYYRNHLIHCLPNATVIDNRVVTAEERERIESSYQHDTIPPNVFTDVRMAMGGGMPIVVPVPQPPPQQQKAAQLRVLNIDGETSGQYSPSTLQAQGSSGNIMGGRGRPPQSGGNAKIVMPVPSSQQQRTNSADIRAGRAAQLMGQVPPIMQQQPPQQQQPKPSPTSLGSGSNARRK